MRLLTLSVLAALAAPTLAAGADRHPGFYRFAPAPAEVCRQKQEQSLRTPARPQRLTELPPAYAVRLKAEDRTKAAEREACFQLQRSR